MTDKLILKSINELLDYNFYIPYYQRGYRWTEQQVTDLLNDIDNFKPSQIAGINEFSFYCLQPIVVKNCSDEFTKEKKLEGEWFEVVDGQQRLTTFFLILHYANEMWIGKQKTKEPAIKYETREGSTDFLKKLAVDENDNVVLIDKSNLDFYYMSVAYNTIQRWVIGYADRNNKPFDNNGFQSKFNAHSKVIWYHVESTVNSVELFTRLNIGKIPLTNSELIKALFLSESSFEKESNDDAHRKKIEIAKTWDEIELKMRDESFWSFLTNAKQSNFSNKIELLFDMIANKIKEEDPLFTFLYFSKIAKDNSDELWFLWLRIEQYYQTICEWFKDRILYHKIGCLIAIGYQLKDLIDLSLKLNKDNLELHIDDEIRKSLRFEIENLSYENSGDYKNIEKVLLLFNVISVCNSKNQSEFYPFKYHKGVQWSLEHIHAQHSEALDKNKKEQWIKWLDYHGELIEELVQSENNPIEVEKLNALLEELNKSNSEIITWEKYIAVSDKIVQYFSSDSDEKMNDLHSISNLALLSQPDNAALNNAVFEVKRREIIKLDKNGSYIPLCTRRVFLKYYNDTVSSQQFYFWSKDDRDNYLQEIKKVLIDYLPKQSAI